MYPMGDFTEFFGDLEQVGDGGAQAVARGVDISPVFGGGPQAQSECDEALL